MLDQAKFVLSKSKVKHQLESLRQYADIISYSLKTNYEVGKVLQEISNCMFSVHSIKAAQQIKNPQRIWYFAQAWNQNEIQHLLAIGITKFVVDNQNDLDILLTTNQKHNQQISLLLRMRLKEHTLQTGKHFVYGFYSGEINKLLPELKNNPNIKQLGIHFHRKTQNISEWSLKQELEQSIACWENIDIVNIGGGLPSIYVNYRPGIIQTILKKILELRQWLNTKNTKVIMEPGRYIAAPSVKLITKIKNIYRNNIIINCSVYNAAMDTFVAHIRLLVEEEVDAKQGKPYTIKGSTPDSVDIFRYKVYLKNPKVGDTLTFLNAGAYNFTTDFCLLPKLKTQVVD